MKNIKWILFGAAVILAVCLFKCSGCERPANEVSKVEEPESLNWITDGGDIVASLKGDPEAFAAVDQHILDSIAKVYQTKQTNLLEYIVVLQHSISDLKQVPGAKEAVYYPPSASDSCPPQIKSMRDSFSNAYYTAKVQLGDSPYLKLTGRDSLTLVWKQGREGKLFNKRDFLQVDISNANPDNRIDSIVAFRRTVKQKSWAISGQAGYGVMTNFKQTMRGWYAGIGISKNLIRF